MNEASEEHNKIVIAILEGDADGARNHLEDHVETGRLRLHEAVWHDRTG